MPHDVGLVGTPIETTLINVCHRITDGKHGDCENQEGSGFYFLSCKDVRDGRLSYEGARQIMEADFQDTHRRTQLEAGDILITNSGTIGRMAIAPNDNKTKRTTFQKSVAILKPDVEKVQPIWLYYYLLGEVSRLVANAGGTAQKNLLLRDMRAFEIEVPPLPTQRRIAAILSAYDDLIENNTRRIAILEEMAQRLYVEWFVHFRFPGHEGVKMVESEIGPIPEGWNFTPFVAIADVLSGGTPKKTEAAYWAGSIPFYTPKDAPSSFYALTTENHITEGGLAKCNSKLYPKDTVFITARGTVGKVALASENMAMNQSCYALRPRDGFGPLFLFLATLGAVRELRSRSHGTVFDTIIVDTFRQLQAIVPKKEIAQQFEERVRPLFGMVLNLQRQNANLRAQRDLLLPKLISGEIDVSEIGEPMAEVAAE